MLLLLIWGLYFKGAKRFKGDGVKVRDKKYEEKNDDRRRRLKKRVRKKMNM